jgi:hypothetical protein
MNDPKQKLNRLLRTVTLVEMFMLACGGILLFAAIALFFLPGLIGSGPGAAFIPMAIGSRFPWLLLPIFAFIAAAALRSSLNDRIDELRKDTDA